MNLEVELLKKELQTLRTEVELLRKEFDDTKKSNYFRITYSFISDSKIDPKTYLMKWKDCYPDALIRYVYSTSEDPLYKNQSLNIYAYKHQITLYLELTVFETPERLENVLSIKPKTIKPYPNQTSLWRTLDIETHLFTL